MSKRTLRGRLLISQIVVAAVACVSLVAAAVVAGGTIIRRDQDRSLSSLADTLCSGIQHELAERYPELNMDSAASHFFMEAHIEQYQFELWDGSPSLLASRGEYSGIPAIDTPAAGGSDRCRSTVALTDWQADDLVLRLCTRRCGEHRVRVGAADVLASRPVRKLTIGLAVALPVALLLASTFGWITATRLLRPLRRLSDASSAMVIEPGMSLGVAAEHEELAQLERAFDALLVRVSDLVEREQRFASQASHELRTPLTQLRLRLERIRETVSDVSTREEIDAALRSARMLDRLTESLLLLARSESDRLPVEPVNVCDIVRGLAGVHEGLELPLTAQSTDDEILVTGNEELLTRAVVNLIENAQKYAGRGARVTLRAYRERDQAVIEVEDDGPGVPPDVRDTVLERFSRGAAHRSGSTGVGLGLSVVDSIARRHGGRVELRPGAAGGERVRICIPLRRVDLSG